MNRNLKISCCEYAGVGASKTTEGAGFRNCRCDELWTGTLAGRYLPWMHKIEGKRKGTELERKNI